MIRNLATIGPNLSLMERVKEIKAILTISDRIPRTREKERERERMSE